MLRTKCSANLPAIMCFALYLLPLKVPVIFLCILPLKTLENQLKKMDFAVYYPYKIVTGDRG